MSKDFKEKTPRDDIHATKDANIPSDDFPTLPTEDTAPAAPKKAGDEVICGYTRQQYEEAITELDEPVADEPVVSLGDIVISLEKAKEQAEEYGHSVNRELCYLFAHGLFHLMGYDHMEEKDKVKMREKEENILNKLEIKR